eukprot:Pgem_evm1s6230
MPPKKKGKKGRRQEDDEEGFGPSAAPVILDEPRSIFFLLFSIINCSARGIGSIILVDI